MTLNTQGPLRIGSDLNENQRLSEELNSKFGLNTRVSQLRGKYYVINIPSANAELLANLIRPAQSAFYVVQVTKNFKK